MARFAHRMRGAVAPLQLLMNDSSALYSFASTTSNPLVYSPTLNVGPANPHKHVLIFSGCRHTGDRDITDVQVDGVQAVQIAESEGTNTYSGGIWIAHTPTSAGNIVADITRDSAPYNAFAYALMFEARSGYVVRQSTVFSGVNTGRTVSLNVSAGGLMIGGTSTSNNWSVPTYTPMSILHSNGFDGVDESIAATEYPDGYTGTAPISQATVDAYNLFFLSLRPGP